MADKDLYQLLGVKRTATADEIKKAYRKLARKYHPDVNPGNAQAEAKFKEMSSAFDILSDPEKRKAYDEFGEDATRVGFDAEKARAYKQWTSQASRPAGFGGASHGGPGGVEFDLGDLFGGMGVNLGDLFGGGRAGSAAEQGGARYTRGRSRDWQASMPGHDLNAHMTISFMEAAKGASKDIMIDNRSLTVKIPAGIASGQTIRLAGQGGAGSGGGPTGDLLIELTVTPHPLLKREGADLHLDVPVTIDEAMFGARINVPTLDGDVKLTIPPHSQSGTTLRLKGKGLPTKTAPSKTPHASDTEHGHRHNHTHGDLYVTLIVHVPDPSTDSETAHRAAAELRALYRGDVRANMKL